MSYADFIRHRLRESNVVSLSQHKSDKAMNAYVDALRGVVGGEQEFFRAGKFTPFAETYIESGFAKQYQPVILLMVNFRDIRKSPEARQLAQQLRAERFRITPGAKVAKGFQNTDQSPMGIFAEKSVSLAEAREIFQSRESSPYGAYQASRNGFRTSHHHAWDARGVGFNLIVGGYDHRRSGEFGEQFRQEFHIIDSDADMQEVAQTFAMIQRARMKAIPNPG